MQENTITLLTKKQYSNSEDRLDIIRKYGRKASISDFAILLGGEVSSFYYTSDGNRLENRTCTFWTKSQDGVGSENVNVVQDDGGIWVEGRDNRDTACRPALLPSTTSKIPLNGVRGDSGVLEVQYGEYPQQAVDEFLNSQLEDAFKSKKLQETGKTYTTDSERRTDYSFKPQEHRELEYMGKKYIRVIANLQSYELVTLSNGVVINSGDAVWVEVQPITWLVDEKTGILLAKKGLFAGVRFHDPDIPWPWDGDFEKSEMNTFLQEHFKIDMVPSRTLSPQEDRQNEKNNTRKKNPYNLNFDPTSVEEQIRAALKSDTPIFLHGKPGEGKTARVFALDPDCEVLYLSNATPDSLNGKTVYADGAPVDIPPTWYIKFKEKCEATPDKIHILFLDEITNAHPTIQGMAFNMVLKKEVNSKWLLPSNARIVAAGNEMADSLAANPLAEPLFGRFAHIYIDTSIEEWLMWAMNAGIHPAIFAYIMFKGEAALRTPYTGEEPNADPRKWEMASRMLYNSGQATMLEPLIGKDLTRDFIQFCKLEPITLEDVIADRYSEDDLEMNISEKWSTVAGLVYVGVENVKKVRDFVIKLGPELVSVFDSLWASDDEKRLEIIKGFQMISMAETYNYEGGIKI